MYVVYISISLTLWVLIDVREDDTAFLEILPIEETADELTSNFNVVPRTRFDLQALNRPTEILQLDVPRHSTAADFRLLCKDCLLYTSDAADE